MEVPVKGRPCRHVQCFDLGTFLHYEKSSLKLECTVCNNPTAKLSSLIILPYIEHALQHLKKCDEMDIMKRVEMLAVERKHTFVSSADEDRAAATTVVDLDPSCASASSGKHATPSENTRVEVVDLTRDSDEGEQEN